MKRNLLTHSAIALLLGSLSFGLTSPAQAQLSSWAQRVYCEPTNALTFCDTLEVFMDSEAADSFAGAGFSSFMDQGWSGASLDRRHALCIGVAPDSLWMGFDLSFLGPRHPLSFDLVVWDGGPYTGVIMDTYRITLDGNGAQVRVPLAEEDINFGSAPIPLNPALFYSAIAGNNLALTWTSTSGKGYRVQFKEDFNAGNWTDLSGDVTASGRTASKTVSMTAARRFYRVQELP